MVTSGAVAFGKLRMKQEQLLSQSVRHTLLGSPSDHVFNGARGSLDGSEQEELEPRACAAAGQAGLMALYETMFAQYGVSCAQVGLHYTQLACVEVNSLKLQSIPSQALEPLHSYRSLKEPVP